MLRFDADVLVIGSGFGGSVAALRAAEAGHRVVVLERGGRLNRSHWERIATGDAPLFKSRFGNGPVALQVGGGLIAGTGNAVGGGSNIYTAVTVPPRAEIFENGWPEGFDLSLLNAPLGRVESVIRPRTIATELPRMRALRRFATELGGESVALPLSLRDGCDAPVAKASLEFKGATREIAQWLQGGLRTAKRPLTETYLAQAEARGAEIRAEHEATEIEPVGGGYRVNVDRIVSGDRISTTLTARRVYLAAGTLNTNRLLLHCRDAAKTLPNLSRQLGERFYTNGDFGAALLVRDGQPQPDDGPAVTGWIDLWAEHRLFLMELGLQPLLLPGRHRPWLFGVMGDARLAGQLTHDRRGRLRHAFSRAEYSAFRERVMILLCQSAHAADAKLMPIPGGVFRRAPTTVHPLGGAAMADDVRQGVVDRFGEVFGYPGLFVCDGSLLPVPIGTAPSMTIAALAEYIMANHD